MPITIISIIEILIVNYNSNGQDGVFGRRYIGIWRRVARRGKAWPCDAQNSINPTKFVSIYKPARRGMAMVLNTQISKFTDLRK